MAENLVKIVQNLNVHHSKIDVVKYEGTNNFGM